MAEHNPEGIMCPYAIKCAIDYERMVGEITRNPILPGKDGKLICKYAVVRNMGGCAVVEKMNADARKIELLEKILQRLEAKE
jgi:hypothetical protein